MKMRSNTNKFARISIVSLLLATCILISIFLCSCTADEEEPINDDPVDPAIVEAEQVSRQYRAMVTDYVGEIILNECDKAIAESEYGFIPVKEENMDYYQFYNGDLDYYYIRNRFYLAEFTDEELEYLKTRAASEDKTLTDEDRQFVQDTFMRVISEEIEGVDGVYDMDYGYYSPSGWFAPSDNLVLGFRYDDLNLNGMTDEEWSDNLWDQREFLLDQTNIAIKAIKETLGWDTTFFVYDDYHVNPLNEFEGARYAD